MTDDRFQKPEEETYINPRTGREEPLLKWGKELDGPPVTVEEVFMWAFRSSITHQPDIQRMRTFFPKTYDLVEKRFNEGDLD